MAERYSSRQDLVEGGPNAGRIGIAIIIAIILIIILVVVIVIALRNKTSSSTGTGTLKACVTNVDCSGAQVCNTITGTCVDCVSDVQCTTSLAPICNTSTNKCVNCVNGNDCPVGRPLCESNICIQCSKNTDCGGATPLCNAATNTCVGCTQPSDCSGSTPLCGPANQCVECIGNNNCTVPSTCINGSCCDVAPPTINSLTANACVGTGNPASFTGTYSFSQTGSVEAIFQVADHAGNVLFTTSAIPANGIISISSGNSGVTFYAQFSYQVSVAIVSPCAVTPFSAPSSVSVPLPLSSNYTGIPLIADASATTGLITVDLSFPSTLFWDLYFPNIMVSADSSLDPNRWTIQYSDFLSINGSDIRVQGAWPVGGIASGQIWYVRVVGTSGNSTCDPSVVSPAVQIIVA